MILKYKNSILHYTISGEGSAIVLLHGFLENVAMWNNLIPEFMTNHKVICVDLLGHGESDCLGYVHTMEDMADAVLEVLNHLKINKASFIGHSMGGYVALALAEKQPTLFKGLCLMNSTFEADSNERKTLRTRAIKMAHTNYESLIRMSFANLFVPESREKYELEYGRALDLALQTPVQGYIAAQEGMKLRSNRLDIFKDLSGKKLIILGKKDSLIEGEKLLNKILNTDITFKKFSEGHMSHIENKSELSYFLKRFVEK